METFNLTLTVDQLNLIIAGLSELPFKTSSGLIQEIIQQVETSKQAKLEKAM